ncbi:hypothetical protein BC829DRAFT_405414 [Chytridium lagenaria]|nr:hypothetical protein BC829DRAFT_405414 [Chytridium lagenaria]
MFTQGASLRQRSRSRHNLLGLIKPGSTSSPATGIVGVQPLPLASAGGHEQRNSSSISLSTTTPRTTSPDTQPGSTASEAPSLQRFPMLAAKAAAAFEAAVRKAKGGSSKTGAAVAGSSSSSSSFSSAATGKGHRFYQGRHTGQTHGSLSRSMVPNGDKVKKDRSPEEEEGSSRPWAAPRGRTFELVRNQEELRTDEVKSRHRGEEEEGDALDMLYQHVRKVASSGGLSGSTACGIAEMDHGHDADRRALAVPDQGSDDDEDEGAFYLNAPRDEDLTSASNLAGQDDVRAVGVTAGLISMGLATGAREGGEVKTEVGCRLSEVMVDDDDEEDGDEDDDLDSLDNFSDEDEFEFDAMSVSSVLTSVGSDDETGSPNSRPPSTSFSGVGLVSAGVKRRVSKLSRQSNASAHSRERIFGARRMRPSSGYSRMSVVEGSSTFEPSQEDIRRLSQLQLEGEDVVMVGGNGQDRPPSQDVSQKCYVFVNESMAFAGPPGTLPPVAGAPPATPSARTIRLCLAARRKSSMGIYTPEALAATRAAFIVAQSADVKSTSDEDPHPLPPLPASTTSTNLAKGQTAMTTAPTTTAAAVTPAANPTLSIQIPSLPSTATAISAEPIAQMHQIPGCFHVLFVGTLRCEDTMLNGVAKEEEEDAKENGDERTPELSPSSTASLPNGEVLVKNEGDAPAITFDGQQQSVFACSCGKFFMNISNLKIHHRTHLDKPFICEYCDRRFLRKHDLRRHAQTHSANAPIFKCEVCLTTFTRADALNRHVKGKRCRGPPQSNFVSVAGGSTEVLS